MILIISIDNDYSTTAVIEWLNFFKKKWIRVNQNQKIFVDFINDDIIFRTNEISFKLSEITSCWYRRGFLNLNFKVSCKIKKIEDFNIIESSKVEQYIYYKLSLLKNINKFTNSTVNKLIVSEIARNLEIKTPNDYLVNTKNELRKIITNNKQEFITKSIWGNPTYRFDNFSLFNYTQKVDIKKIETNNFALSLVQNYIDKKYELRIFYLDESFYSMAIFSQNNMQKTVDFRNSNTDKPIRTVPFLLPKEIQKKLTILMKKLDLNCGSIDMVVNTNNEYFFIEVNPIGQFGMVSFPCNYNLEKVIANYL